MRTIALVYRTARRELHNARRKDVRMRTGARLGAALGLGLAWWGAGALAARVAAWQSGGVLGGWLGLLLLGAWWGAALWSAAGALRLGLAGEEQRSLLTLPLGARERWHALLGRLAAEWLGGTLLLGLGVPAAALLLALGAAGLPWALALAAGGALAAYLGAAAPFLLLAARDRLLGWAERGVPGGLGPAGLYARACYAAEARDRAPLARTLPGAGALARALEQWRTPAAALLRRGLLAQSRRWSFWGRVCGTALLVTLYPTLSRMLADQGLGGSALPALYAAALALLTIADGASSPLGAEGERLSLFLVAPLSAGALLRAKLTVFTLLFVGEAVALGAALALRDGRGLAGAACAAALAGLAMLGVCALFVGGSAADVDLVTPIDTPAAAFLHEEVPATLVRLALIGLAGLLLAAHGALAAWLPGAWGLAAQAALSAAVAMAALAFGRRALTRLAR